MDKNFSKEYQNLKDRALLTANAYFFDHMEEIMESFREGLKGACERVGQWQQRGWGPVEYLEVTLLRTRLLNHDYAAPIMAYGEDWYADRNQAQAGEIDAGCIFSFYEEMILAASKLVKKYRTRLPERCLEECMCAAADDFWNYVAMGCRQAAKGFSPEGLEFTEDFRVRCCEYMGYGELCWRYTPEMTLEEMQKWFDKRETDAYIFRDFKGKDFSGWNFSGLDLTGCDFRDCKLDGCSFEGADLTDVWFCGSSMKEVSLETAWIPGARFDRADLRGAALIGAYSSCRINGDAWLRPDLVWASFVNAELRGADLTFSAIECADFTGADMEGALLNDSHRDYYRLDETQKARIRYLDTARGDDGMEDSDIFQDTGAYNGEDEE